MTISWRMASSMLLVLVVCATAHVCYSAAKTETYVVSVPRLDLGSGERIISFDIGMSDGLVKSVSNLPWGWFVEISNDPSSKIKIKGRIGGAPATLAPEDFYNFTISVEKQNDGEKPGFFGQLSLLKDYGHERNISLKARDFKVVKK